jgi:hypothetical protein
MLRKEVFNDLINFSTDNNFTIISNDITGISFPVNEIMGVENHYKYHENLHIGIALFDPKDLSYDRASLKPSNKVTSLASFDIPVVCSYQSALDPMIKKFPFFRNSL